MPKALRITALVAVVAVIVIAIIASVSYKPSNQDQVWDAATTLGVEDGKNYFIVYSDLACPYCIAFENAILEHEDEFQQYLEDNNILFEVRLSEYLYEFGETRPDHSRYGAVAAYCAKNEGKFWDYYNHAISTTWNDFYKTGGKAGGAGLADLGKEYWIDLGKDIGLGDTFASCVENDETLDAVKEATAMASKTASGMPSYKFNKFTTGGFNMEGDWDDVKMLFQMGLES